MFVKFDYDVHTEPEAGYLVVSLGDGVVVRPGSRSAAAPNNAFCCDYVYAGVPNDDSVGWIPVDVLASRS